MQRLSFVRKIISSLDQDQFNSLCKTMDNERYIAFTFIEHDQINQSVLEEKISDYFEKVELAAGEKKFDSIVGRYMADIDSVVKDRIDGTARAIRPGKQADSRAKRYYEKAMALKKNGLKSFESLLDYSRIMLCLYMAIINNEHKTITDFDYASESISGRVVLESLRNEKTNSILGDKKRFDTQGELSMDRCTFVMVVLIYHYIKNLEVEAEY